MSNFSMTISANNIKPRLMQAEKNTAFSTRASYTLTTLLVDKIVATEKLQNLDECIDEFIGKISEAMVSRGEDPISVAILLGEVASKIELRQSTMRYRIQVQPEAKQWK